MKIVYGVKTMISFEDIRLITQVGKAKGYDVTVKHIAYYILVREFGAENKESSILAFKTLYDSTDAVMVADFEKSEEYKFVKREMRKLERKTQHEDISPENDISYSENRAGMVKEIKYLEKLREQEGIEPKDQVMLSAKIGDLRVKLNDKFGTSEKADQQVIQVAHKFDFICPVTHKECSYQTKEFVKDLYGLTEKEDTDNE